MSVVGEAVKEKNRYKEEDGGREQKRTKYTMTKDKDEIVDTNRQMSKKTREKNKEQKERGNGAREKRVGGKRRS